MRRRTSLTLSLSIFGALALAAAPAWAVHDLEDVFELENLVNGADAIDDQTTPQDDWGTTDPAICGGLASCGYVAGPSAPGGNSLTSVFLNDVPPAGGLDDVFTGGGSKDDLDISGWKWTTKTGVTDKDDIQQGGAAAYNYEGDTLIYFFQTLFAENGDAAAGVWLLQDKVAPMVNAKGVGQFMEVDGAGNPVGVASHDIGDVFVSAKLSNGGRNVQMVVYKWVGSNNAADCPGGAAALAPPKKSLCIIETDLAANCGTVGPDHIACGTMNLRPTESPDDWGYLGKSPPDPGPAYPPGTDGIDSGDFPATTFFEGGFNLTELGLTGCFSTFLLETRSSDSVRSELKDFTMGEFPLCGIEVTKLCSPFDPTGGANPAIGPFGDSIITTFDILIENTGVATVYDVELEEDEIFAMGEYCEIYDTGAPLGTDTPVIVASELMAGESVPVTIQCETYGNPFYNSVTARAKSSDTLSDPDIEDSDALVGVEPGTPRAEGGACPAVFDSGLSVFKDCEEDPTTLVLDASGRLQIDVGVYFEVTNTGQERLLGVTLEDDKIGTINVGDLAPGQKWESMMTVGPMSYLADAPDGPGSGPWAPGDAYFENTVEVIESTGALSGMDIGVGQTFGARCYLCEPCPDCPE